MFGRMNIDKATKFFISNSKIQIAKSKLKPDSNFLASQWNHYENNVYTDFKRRYKLELSIEQRWHIFLAVMESCPYPIDQSLNDFLKAGINEVAMWSVKASGRYRDKGYPEQVSTKEIIEGFPYFPVFWYSINNYSVVYPNNAKAADFVAHMQALENLNGREAIDNWYRKCLELHSGTSDSTE